MRSNYSKTLKNLPYKAIFKVGFLIAALIFVFVVFKKIGKALLSFIDSFTGTKNDQNNQQHNTDYLNAQRDAINWKNISFGKDVYMAKCDTIFTALQGSFVEDEMTIWRVFKTMKTNDDVKCMKFYWGTRPIGLYGFRQEMTLSQALAYLLSANELNTCNYMLKRNGLQERV